MASKIAHRVNHIAIAVPDMAASMQLFRLVFGAEVSEPTPQPEHGVITSFVKLAPQNSASNGAPTVIELIHPYGENSPIANFMKKNPLGGIHHIAMDTKDIQAAIAQLKQAGIPLLNETPKIGAHGNPVVFTHPKATNGVLLELEEVKDS